MRTTLILAAVAAVLGAYILLIERHQPSTDQRRASRVRLVAAFDRTRVRGVTIARPGVSEVALARAGTAWRVVPGDKAADDAAVDELLAELDFAEADREADVSAEAAGVTPPAAGATLELTLDGGGRVDVALGRRDASGRGVYTRVGGGGAVRVAPVRLLELATRDPIAYRDRRVVPFALADARATVIGWDGGRLDARSGRWRNERGEWVSGARVAEALRRLAELRASRFIDAPPAPPPVVRSIDVAAGGDGTATLREREAGCPAAGEELVERQGPAGADWMCVPAEAMRGAREALAAARARDEGLTGLPAEAVTAIDVEVGERRLALRRVNGRWTFAEPVGGPAVDPAAVDAWLAQLERVRLDLGPAPAGGAARRLTLTTARQTESLAVSAPRAGPSTVERAGEPTAARAPADLPALLDADPGRFRDRTLLDLARFDARRLRVAARGRAAVEVARAEGGAWSATAPTGATADPTGVDRVLGALTNLRAERFVPAATSLAPEVTLVLEEQPPGAPAVLRHEVEVGARRPDGCLGRMSEKGERTTFLLAPATCDDLRAPIAR